MLAAAVRTGDLLDLALMALAVLVGVRGYRRELLVGAGSLIGFVGGALIGGRIAGPVAGLVAPGPARSLIGLAAVLVVATGPEELLGYVAVIGRDALRFRPLRVFDGLFGIVDALFPGGAGGLVVAMLPERAAHLVERLGGNAWVRGCGCLLIQRQRALVIPRTRAAGAWPG